jgi:diacylglycerol kinase
VARVLAAEALKTATGSLTDHLPPDGSPTAKAAKAPGALAVALVLAVTAGFPGLVVAGPV